ncbi:thioredoxin domain-containing protein [bacterium]|nr:thioredoxin domain-containing protein [bacterium]
MNSDIHKSNPESGFHLPGNIVFETTLQTLFREKADQRGSEYRPRTRHLAHDGQARFTNRLFLESSPYLLQHAHNPVNWYPWGDEAFETAKKLNRPVLVSIGYSTCHWCHVMEEESFEDEEIAAYLNTHYITIKVDREERPDVDAIYMSAVQALNGNGGWPLNVMLMPERRPFWGGTYFPARDGDRGVSMGFLSILKRIHQVYTEDRDKLVQTSMQLTEAITSMLTPEGGSDMPEPEILEQAANFYRQRFDHQNGGLQGAPKFPSSLPLRFLFRYYLRSGDQTFLQMAEQTLGKMVAGGMYDQAGGGFHRYSVDAGWQVPHFEKMLYDNALLTVAYLEAFQLTGKELYRKTAIEILHYVSRDMTTPSGAFYSATDADSLTPSGHREEGYFFTWTPEELASVLGREQADIAQRVYNVRPGGNFEGRSILNTPSPLSAIASSLGMSAEELGKQVEEINTSLYEARKKRPQPIRDEKVLTAWNGLMISAFAKAGRILGEDRFTERAKTAADFILSHLYRDGRLFRSYNDSRARFNGYLEDYAFFISALLDLYESTQAISWLDKALELDRILEERFEDSPAGGFFMTSDDHEQLIAREKPNYDGAVPSGNSVALLNLLRMGELTGKAHFHERFRKAFILFLGTDGKNPVALSEMLLAADFFLGRPREIVIVTPEGQPETADPFLNTLRQVFIPNSVLVVVSEGEELDEAARRVSIVAGKTAQAGKATAYVCERGACRQPTTDPQHFMQQIQNE